MEGHTEVVGATGKEMENQTSGGAAEVEAGAEGTSQLYSHVNNSSQS